MFLKHLKHHGRGHGHGHRNKMHKQGGKIEKCCHHFKHPGQHMEKDFFKGKHHRGLDFDRGCFSESDLPETATQTVKAGRQDARNFMPREFHKRRHYWLCEKCCCEKNNGPDENTENIEKGNAPETPAKNAETGETSNAVVISTQNKEGQDKTQVCCYKGWHHFRNHGEKRHHEFNRYCSKCGKKNDETTENETNTDGEKCENKKEKEGYVRKHGGHHYKGKRGFRKCCQEGSGTENDELTGDEEGVKHGYIRKNHHRGHHGGRHGRHHGGGRRHKMGKGCPKCFHELFAAGNKFGTELSEGRRHHGGKWGHGPHGDWRRHCCGFVMVDAAVNTGDLETAENIQEVVEDSTVGQNMEQDGNPEVGQEQSQAENDQVLEVANNLRKSSLE